MLPGPADPNDVREHNLRRVLNVIREERAISRADIARITQLSRSTITNIVNDLLLTDLVQESGTASSLVGRRPIVLTFQYDARLVLGVEMGNSHLTVVAMNLDGRVLAIRDEPFPVQQQPTNTVRRMLHLLDELIEETGYPRDRILGVGVAVPTPLEGKDLSHVSPVILPHWTGMNLKRELAQSLHLPVFLDNDANLGALAERWWGHGREVNDLAYVKIATGVGCGMIINGAIYRGAGGTAGEIGHITIDENGPPCRCGLSGCLEAYTGADAIVQAVHDAIAEGVESCLGSAFTVEEVARAALAGDAAATRVIQERGHYLGIAIAMLLNLVNPALIILGGPITAAEHLLMGPLRQTIRTYSFPKSNFEASLTTSRLGTNAIAVGAATMVIDQLFHSATVPLLHALSAHERR